MADQGWKVDDGTCGPCLRGECHRCTQPREWDTDDHGVSLACCCDESYHLGYVDLDDEESIPLRRPLVVGLDPVMIALLTFWCTVLVRMAMHP